LYLSDNLFGLDIEYREKQNHMNMIVLYIRRHVINLFLIFATNFVHKKGLDTKYIVMDLMQGIIISIPCIKHDLLFGLEVMSLRVLH
jgi:hypothetical protein